MKEVAVISGKGGTGKTSLVGALCTLAAPLVTADCDVDAPDMHLLLAPSVKESYPFEGGWTASIDPETCVNCMECLDACRFDAVIQGEEACTIDGFACEGCGVCQSLCPTDAISMHRDQAGEWFVSETRFGPLVHARLGIAQENSGKLVAQVRKRARQIAEEGGFELVLIDGTPGIGCPVISSITGADLVLVVTEPTVSGAHDLERVLDLARHFRIPASVCVNKCDLNPAMTQAIIEKATRMGADQAGCIPYDEAVTAAMVAEKTIEEYSDGPSARAIRAIWDRLRERLSDSPEPEAVHAYL